MLNLTPLRRHLGQAAPVSAAASAPFTEEDLDLLRRIASGEWDLNARLEAGSEEAETLNQIVASLAQTLTGALRCGVGLYGNVPPLFDFSAQLEGAAKTQEDRATRIAASARQMAAQLHGISGRLAEALQSTASVAGIMADLDARSRQIETVVDRVQRVAGQTKLLSLNASVEAARAGEAGRAFAVVAEEVQKLAADAADATTQIRDVLRDLEQRIGAAVKAVGQTGDHAAAVSRTASRADGRSGLNGTAGMAGSIADGGGAASLTGVMEGIVEGVREQNGEVARVVADIAEIAGEARLQTEGAAKLKEMANRAREGSDALIVSLGAFQLPAHLRPREAVERLALDPHIRSLDRRRMEGAMGAAAERWKFIELLYVTDAAGRQVTENIARKGAAVSPGFGRDWSSRPWFRGPVESGALCLSPIYRSSATDRFCFTVSAPIVADDGRITGVLGVDIDLTQLL